MTLPPLAVGSCLSRAQPAGPSGLRRPGRPGRVADGWTERPPEDSRPGQRKRRAYGAGGVRRKAECGRRRRRPPQQCGPRPSPQVTGRPSPSRPDPPFSSPPGGLGMAKPCFSAPVAPRALRKRISFWGGPTGSGGAWPWSRRLLSGLFKPGVALESCPGRAKLFPGSLGEGAGLERS